MPTYAPRALQILTAYRWQHSTRIETFRCPVVHLAQTLCGELYATRLAATVPCRSYSLPILIPAPLACCQSFCAEE